MKPYVGSEMNSELLKLKIRPLALFLKLMVLRLISFDRNMHTLSEQMHLVSGN